MIVLSFINEQTEVKPKIFSNLFDQYQASIGLQLPSYFCAIRGGAAIGLELPRIRLASFYLSQTYF